ncbi:MAG TPA: hypothetical protein VLC09_17905, partial [Polyangiaceae bacterium]|nr:hypothetical protein [Polyangiaceae bacterium]
MHSRRPSLRFVGSVWISSLVASCCLMAAACGSEADGADGVGGEANASGGSTGTGGESQGTAGAPGDTCEERSGPLEVAVTGVAVSNTSGAAPAKGDRLRLRFSVTASGTGGRVVRLQPHLTSLRFSDYVDVPLGQVEATLCAGTSQLELEVGPFLDDEAQGKHFAIGSGDYVLSRVDVTAGDEASSVEELPGSEFSVATSGALLVPVLYEDSYLGSIQGLTTSTVEEYLSQAFTRPTRVFTPSSADPDGAGANVDYANGFDEMMGTTHHFRPFSGFPGETTTTDG